MSGSLYDSDKRIFQLLAKIFSLVIKTSDRNVEVYPCLVWEEKRSFVIEDLW